MSIKTSQKDKNLGFTIVELIVIIVVIGILAGITILSYRAVTENARDQALQTDLRSSISLVAKLKADNGAYPASFDSSTATNTSGKTVYTYIYDTSDGTFCLQASAYDLTYYATSSNMDPILGTCLGGPLYDREYTAFVYDLTLPGCTGNNVQLPISSPSSSPGSFIDWGDGSTGTLTSANMQHSYAVAKEYTVLYSGPISQIDTTSITASFRPCLSKVSQWGETVQPTLLRFRNSTNLTYVAKPPSSVTNISNIFDRATAFNQPIDDWDVSNVTSLGGAFAFATSFNQPLNSWDISNVTNLNNTFTGASSFNQPLNNWDTSSVTSLHLTFTGATSFNQNINSWNTSNVTSMHGTFGKEACACAGATAFNQPLNNWNTSNVTDMSFMFNGANAFNQPIGNWDTSKVTNMSNMFDGGSDNNIVFNQNINSWNVSNVTNMTHMFQNAASFNQPLNNWNVSKVTSMAGMFGGAPAFNQPLNNWNTAAVTSMGRMFRGASAFNQNISTWNTGNVTSMYQIFQFNMVMNQNLTGWNVSKVTDVLNANKTFDFRDNGNTSWASTSLPTFPL